MSRILVIEDDLAILVLLQKGLQAASKNRVIIGNQDPDRHRCLHPTEYSP